MIKLVAKTIVVTILTWQARLVLKRFRPKIIGITGSVGKTSTKEAVVSVLSSQFKVRGSDKSFNSEIGVPLTILNLDTAWSSVWGWLKNLSWGWLAILGRPANYPEYLVLELGADKPGDIKRLVKWLPLTAAIITRVPDVPVHIEFFDSPQAIVAEKLSLAKAVPAGGQVIINSDDKNIYPPPPLQASVLTYGLAEAAVVRGSDIAWWYDKTKQPPALLGLTFKINYRGNSLPIRIKGTLGRHHVYTYLAAMAAALSQGVNLISAARALDQHQIPPGRMKLLAGVKSSLILDDSYNSSPAALEGALLTLEQIDQPGQKIAILGDMLELGQYTESAHLEAGQMLARFCDYLLVVGERAKFIAEGAKTAGLPASQIQHFTDARAAGKAAELLITSGDTILVKGSQAMRLEQAVEEIMAQPERKAEWLCRQDPAWQAK